MLKAQEGSFQSSQQVNFITQSLSENLITYFSSKLFRMQFSAYLLLLFSRNIMIFWFFYHLAVVVLTKKTLSTVANLQMSYKQLTIFGTLVTETLLISEGKGDRLFAMPCLFGSGGLTLVAPICCPPG